MKNNLIYKAILVSGASIILFMCGFVLNSCRDEIMPVTPLVIGTGCDTANVSFAATVQPLLSDCLSCHNNSTSFAGINLEGYDNVSKAAKSGELPGSLRGTMKAYFSNDDCDFAKVQAWINQGFLNN